MIKTITDNQRRIILDAIGWPRCRRNRFYPMFGVDYDDCVFLEKIGCMVSGEPDDKGNSFYYVTKSGVESAIYPITYGEYLERANPQESKP